MKLEKPIKISRKLLEELEHIKGKILFVPNGGKFALLSSFETKEPIADICKIVPALQPGEFAIKNYSENEGVYPQLITLGIIQPAHRYHSQGYVSFPICKLKIDEL